MVIDIIKYNPNNKKHIFAIAFFCIILDICLEISLSLFLVQIVVNSHLRVVVAIDQKYNIREEMYYYVFKKDKTYNLFLSFVASWKFFFGFFLA